ncbi:GreA/GreB family elongation factor [Parasphingorhabdus pacifica]
MEDSRSTDAREQLEAELARLREQSRELAPGTDDDHVGDRGDDAQALARADERAWVNNRIKEITRRLNHLGQPPPSGEGLPEGTRITLRYPDGTVANMRVGDEFTGTDAADQTEPAPLTPASPLGRALVGCQAGDNITYETPAGEAYAQVQDIQLPKLG